MKKTDISKAELLKQRKERKRQKKAEKRKAKITRFAVKLSALLFVVILLYVGVFSWVLWDNPYCDESNTMKKMVLRGKLLPRFAMKKEINILLLRNTTKK